MAAVSGVLRCGIRLWGYRLWGQPKVSAAAHLKKGILGVIIPAKNHYGKDSALGHLLGVDQEQESPVALGQHPPPVSIHKDEQDMLLMHCPNQPENPKVLRVAIIGAPNAGKSTLSNMLLGRKVFPVSTKVHTTRSEAKAVITDANTQMILLDTPGFITKSKMKRHNLEKSLLQGPWNSVKAANVVVVLVDMADTWTRHQLHPEVMKCLSTFPEIPSVLVMNKVDLVKKKSILLDLVEELTEGFVNGKKLQVRSAIKPTSNSPQNISQPLVAAVHTDIVKADSAHKLELAEDVGGTQKETWADNCADSVFVTSDVQQKRKPKGWPRFQEIFMLSAVSGEEVETLKTYLLTLAKPSPWEFHSDVLTTQSPQEICNNIIRSKLLDHLPQEVPYTITQIIETWEEGPCGELVVLQNLVVQKDGHAKMLIGPGGQVISKIAQEAGEELMNIFLCEVNLKLAVKVKK